MELTVLGSGGCMPIPRPLCQCSVCREARKKGFPFRRTGPSIFLHDQNLLIDTPADIAAQLNREGIRTLKNILFIHLEEYWNRSFSDYRAMKKKTFVSTRGYPLLAL